MDMTEEVVREVDALLGYAWFDRLVSGRNRIMVERMDRHLQAGHAFIAVGAAHLPGEQGILRLLELRGFEVTRIY